MGVQTVSVVRTGTLGYLCPFPPIELVVGAGSGERSHGPPQETIDNCRAEVFLLFTMLPSGGTSQGQGYLRLLT